MAVVWKKLAYSDTKLDDWATPDNNTDLDFSTARHGLVPKGTNVGDFLKDDGTWAAGGGGVSDPHGADQHTDVTRYLFLPTTEGHIPTGVISASNYYSHVQGGANAYEPAISLSMKVPDDFVSFVSFKALWRSPAASGNMYWYLRARYATPGEIDSTHLDAAAFGVTATGGNSILNLQEPANPLILSDLDSGDYLGLYFERNGSNASDTLDAVAQVLGFLFTYIAHQ